MWKRTSISHDMKQPVPTVKVIASGGSSIITSIEMRTYSPVKVDRVIKGGLNF